MRRPWKQRLLHWIACRLGALPTGSTIEVVDELGVRMRLHVHAEALPTGAWVLRYVRSTPPRDTYSTVDGKLTLDMRVAKETTDE